MHDEIVDRRRRINVPILLPTGRDAELVAQILDGERVQFVFCASMQELLDEIARGCGPFIIGDEILFKNEIARLVEALDNQPDWSDLPGMILIGRTGKIGLFSSLAARREMILVQRPVKKSLLINFFRAALMARRRQYQVRDLLEELVQTNEKLHARTELLRKFAMEVTRAENNERKRVAQILHDDLQQMLASARLYTEMLLGELGKESRRKAKPIYDIISDAMSASRTLSHELNPAFAICGNINATVDKIATGMSKKYGFQVRTAIKIGNDKIDEDIGIFIYRSLQELLFNCAKHAKAKNVSIELIGQEEMLKLVMEDDGVGFNPDQLNILGGDRGGFGLFSIQERATALSGSLKVHSTIGKGSRFILEIPVPSKLQDRETAPDMLKPAKSGDSESQPKISVLIADDHAVMRQGLAALLRNQPDIDVIAEAADGQQAVSLALSCNPAVILMDYSMPFYNGAQATRIIKNKAPGIEVIGLSMHDGQNERQSMFDAGARAYLKKDVQAAELIATIKQCVLGKKYDPANVN